MFEYIGLTHPTLVLACVTALCISRAGAAAGAPDTPVLPGHPRLLVTPGDMPYLQRQAAAYPEEWKRVQEAALRPARDAGYDSARVLTNAALAYLISRDDRYLTSAVADAENICRKHEFNQYASPEALFALALAYDWCYPALTAPQREEIQQAILRIADYLRDRIWRHSDFNNHFVLEKVWPSVYAGLALHGDCVDPRVDEYLRTGSDYLHNNLLPAANLMAGNTGGQFEGYSYDSWGYMRPMAFVFEAWRTATGEDLFASCTAARYNALWNIYGARPFDGKLEHFDDAGLQHHWSASNETAFIYLLARHYRDQHAQWMGDQIERRYDSALWPIIRWRDPELTPQAPTDLPTARRFEPLGWVLMRSSWESDATFASFQCGPFITGHQHLDNNAFTIHKHSLLAIDPGVNAYGEETGDHYRANYYSRTIAHNSVTVYDPSETFLDGPWAGDDHVGAANDGGQVRMRGAERAGEFKPGSPFPVGVIAAYAHGDLYTYAVGDATRSYSPAKLTLFRRHFLFLPPDLFVVFDQVVSTNPSFRKAWILHSVNEPAVEGALATITSGDGRLVSLTVLPKNPIITKIGGPGKECWVDGGNWPSLEEREWPPEAGAWRLEVSPSEPANEDLFLHVLQVGGDDIARPDAVSLMEPGAQHAVPAVHGYRRLQPAVSQPDTNVGAQHATPPRVGLRMRAQGREYRVTFSTAGPSAHLEIAQNGEKVLDQKLP